MNKYYYKVRGSLFGPVKCWFGPADIEWIAESCAQRDYENLSSGELAGPADWPQEYIIYAGDKTTQLGRCSVRLDLDPSFTAHKIGG